MVPEGWSLQQLHELAEIKRGAGSQYLRYVDGPDDGIRLIRIGDFLGDNPKFVEHTDAMERFILRSGDILIAGTGATAGIIFEVPSQFDGFAFSYNAPRIRPKQNVDKGFLVGALQSNYIQKQKEALFTGNAQPFLDTKAIGGFEILLPPLAEQKRISEVLGVWDRAIAVAGQQLDLARTQKRALMQTLLTPTRRFPGYEGQPWKEVRLGDVAEIKMGSSPKSEAYNDAGDGLPLIQGNADIKNRQTVPRAFTTEITQTCEVGDILMSVRAPVGTVAVSAHRACVGRGAAVVLPKPGCDWGWLFQSMLFLEDKWAKVSQGSTFDAVNSKDMKSVLVNFPKDLGEQRAIAATLETADAEITTLETQITRLQAEKKALMQQLLTGKKRVFERNVDGP